MKKIFLTFGGKEIAVEVNYDEEKAKRRMVKNRARKSKLLSISGS